MFKTKEENGRKPEIIKGRKIACKCTNCVSFEFDWERNKDEKVQGRGKKFLLQLDDELIMVPIWFRIDEKAEKNMLIFGFDIDKIPQTAKKILWKAFLWMEHEGFNKIIIKEERSNVVNSNVREAGLILKDSITKANIISIMINIVIGRQTPDLTVPLYKKFEELRNNKCLTDVRLVCEGNEFSCHCAVLAAMSTVFEAMLNKQFFKESISKTIEIQDFTKEELEIAIKFMYTHEQDIIESHAPRLLVFADKYDIEILRFACENILLDNLNEQDIVFMLILGSKTNSKQLKTHVLNKLKLNWSKYKQDPLLKKALKDEACLVIDLLYHCPTGKDLCYCN